MKLGISDIVEPKPSFENLAVEDLAMDHGEYTEDSVVEVSFHQTCESIRSLLQIKECVESSEAVSDELKLLFADEVATVGIDFDAEPEQIVAKIDEVIESTCEALSESQAARLTKATKRLTTKLAELDKKHVKATVLVKKIGKLSAAVYKADKTVEMHNYPINVAGKNMSIIETGVMQLAKGIKSGKFKYSSTTKQFLKDDLLGKIVQDLEKTFDLKVKAGKVANKEIEIASNYVKYIDKISSLLDGHASEYEKFQDLTFDVKVGFFDKKKLSPEELLYNLMDASVAHFKFFVDRLSDDMELLNNIVEGDKK